MWTAVTREISPALGDCELSFVDRAAIDVSRAEAQHREYLRALEALGCNVLTLPAEAALPDSVFVEDTAIVLDEVAVLTRPGALSRRGEVASIGEVLRRYRTVLDIEAPGTLDGGDVLHLGRTLYVGQSARSNAAGIAQLRERLAAYGYTVHAVATMKMSNILNSLQSGGKSFTIYFFRCLLCVRLCI